jgi:phosphonate transport system permease protein
VTQPPRPAWLRLPTLLVLVAVVAAWHGSEGQLSALAGPEARRAIADLARGFWPPAHSAEFLARLGRPLLETVAIATLGMGLAIALGAPLALLATSPAVDAACGRRPGLGRRALHAGARAILNVMRAVPEIVWALLFVRALGIGPAPGVLAIAISYAGVVGKVFAEIVEAAPRRPAEALAAAGASPRAALALGIGPSARPVLLSYALYRFDCALRSSAVLGIVGAGGIGQEIELSLKMFEHHEVAAFVLALFALVAAVDLASTLARRALQARASLFPTTVPAAARGIALGLGALAAMVGSAAILGLRPAELFGPGVFARMGAFVAGLWPIELTPAVLRAIGPAALETLAVSVLGTALAAALGLGLAFVAARPPAATRTFSTGAGGGARHAVRLAAATGARGVLALGRTLPELLWALLFTFAVGLGPFAGALALAIHTAGVLGRLYAEVLEEVPDGPALALRTAGATPLEATALGVVPQAFPQLVAYTLYRWEVNIRASAILGVVGAGGIGRDLHVALSIFDTARAGTLIVAIFVLVTAVDLASGWLRARLAGGGATSARAVRAVLSTPSGAEPGSARAW